MERSAGIIGYGCHLGPANAHSVITVNLKMC